MLKRHYGFKKVTALMSSVIISACMLSGCSSEAWDQYLRDLGIRNPDVYEDEDEEASSATEYSYVISEDTPAGAPNVYYQENNEDAASVSETGTGMNDGAVLSEERAAREDSGGDDSVFISSYKKIKDSETDERLRSAREKIGITEESLETVKRQQEGNYAYERLTGSGKTLYAELLIIMQGLGEDIPVSTTSDEAIELVFDYVMADHPEIFYVDGYQYTNYTLDDVVTKITFTGNYLYDKEEVERRQKLVNEAVNACLAGAPSSTDDYYAIKYVYDYIIDNTDYDVDAVDNQNICSVFIDGRSVCNGYSKAAQYLLNKLGIPCTLVTGTVTTKNATGIRHAWNLVLCNDAYYYMDVTWGDASYQTSSGETADSTKFPAVNYDYLNVSTQEISRNHQISDLIYMPTCNSMKDNYYVREDEYFTYAEPALVRELFERRYADGSDSVTIKCASDAVYDALFQMLITDRGVFNYLHDETSVVSYTTFADTKTMIFWL